MDYATSSFIKRVSRAGNYKNVGKTIARRHQFWICYQMLLTPHMLKPQLDVSPKQVSSTLSCEDGYIQKEIKLANSGYSDNMIVIHPEWVNLQSFHFSKGAYIMLAYDTVRLKFGKIFDIITFNNNSNLVLCVVEYFGDMFVPHYNAFIIKTKGVISAISVLSLSDHRPLLAHQNSSDHSLYITLP